MPVGCRDTGDGARVPISLRTDIASSAAGATKNEALRIEALRRRRKARRGTVLAGKPDTVDEVVHSIRMARDERAANSPGVSLVRLKGGWMKSGVTPRAVESTGELQRQE